MFCRLWVLTLGMVLGLAMGCGMDGSDNAKDRDDNDKKGAEEGNNNGEENNNGDENDGNGGHLDVMIVGVAPANLQRHHTFNLKVEVTDDDEKLEEGTELTASAVVGLRQFGHDVPMAEVNADGLAEFSNLYMLSRSEEDVEFTIMADDDEGHFIIVGGVAGQAGRFNLVRAEFDNPDGNQDQLNVFLTGIATGDSFKFAIRDDDADRTVICDETTSSATKKVTLEGLAVEKSVTDVQSDCVNGAILEALIVGEIHTINIGR